MQRRGWWVVGLCLCLWSSGRAQATKKVEFYHTSIQEVRSGEYLELSANMPVAGPVVRIVIRLRLRPGSPYRSISMPLNKGDYYEARIPGKRFKPPRLHYYIIGIDARGKSHPLFASARRPHRVKVLPPQQRASLMEELSVFGAEPQVYSAARRKQNITESSSAITVLRSEDILNVGSFSLPEILMQVPGMEAVFITRADPNLSIRGFSREGSNKLLALLDGRSVYIDLFGITFWEALPVSLLEIDRIEVIRGPGSSLYGANAFSGVINIFTIDPHKMKGFRYHAQAGPEGTYATFVGGATVGKSAFRLSTTYNRQSDFEDWRKKGFETLKGHVSWSHKFQKEIQLQVSGGFSRDLAERIQSLFGNFQVAASQAFAKVNLELHNFRLQMFWSGLNADLSLGFPLPEKIALSKEKNALEISLKDLGITQFGPELLAFEAHTFDIEPQYTIKFWEGRDRLVVGGNFRVNSSEADQLKIKKTNQLLASGFLQNELKITDWMLLTVGGRFDLKYTDIEGHPSLYRFSPHGAVILKPHPNHTLRMTAGLAFRYPAFLESGLELELVKGRTLEVNGTKREIPALEFKGERNLDPEQLLSLELGYAGRLFQRVLINVDVYFQNITSLILFEGDVSAIFDYFTIYSGFSSAKPKTAFTFTNDLSAYTFGLEASVRFLITKWLQGFVNYAYQQIKISEIKGESDPSMLCEPGHKCPPLIEDDSPQHKVNFGLNFKFQRVRMNLYGHYVHQTKRINFITRLPNARVKDPISGNENALKDLTRTDVLTTIPSYFLLNFNASVAIWPEKLEVGVTIRNLIGLLTGGFAPIEGDGFVRENGQITGVQPGYHIEYPRLNLFGKQSGGQMLGGSIQFFMRGRI